MKVKSIIIFALTFMVVYIIAINLIALFSFSFSTSKPGLFTKVYVVFTKFPLNPVGEGLSGKQFLVFQSLDGLFWGAVIYAVFFLVRLIKKPDNVRGS